MGGTFPCASKSPKNNDLNILPVPPSTPTEEPQLKPQTLQSPPTLPPPEFKVWPWAAAVVPTLRTVTIAGVVRVTNCFGNLIVQQVLEYREFHYRDPCNTGIFLMVTIM